MRTCAIINCENKGIHRFPNGEVMKQKWIKATRIDVHRKIGWRLRKFTCICSEHFTLKDFQLHGKKGKKKRILKRTAVPTLFPWNSNASVNSTLPKMGLPPDPFQLSFNPAHAIKNYSRSEPQIAFAEEYSFLEAVSQAEADPLLVDIRNVQDYFIPDVGQEVKLENIERASSSSIQLNLKDAPKCLCESKACDLPFSVYKYKDNDSAIDFFTGLETYQKLLYLYSTLGDCSNLKYFYNAKPTKLAEFEQFFLTLKILRRHLEFEYIGMLYNISLKEVTNIFVTWTRLLTNKWKLLDLWVNRECATSYMPIDLYYEHSSKTGAIDCTEGPTKEPGRPFAQQATFSSCKCKNTIQFLIGIAPTGLITHVLPANNGSVTDKQSIERINRLHEFNYNDEIMVDNGFNGQDTLIPYGVDIIMPTFDRNINETSSNTLPNDCKFDSKKVDVETIVQMLKTYKILEQPMNQTETILASDIVFVCSMLVNFRINIANKCS